LPRLKHCLIPKSYRLGRLYLSPPPAANANRSGAFGEPKNGPPHWLPNVARDTIPQFSVARKEAMEKETVYLKSQDEHTVVSIRGPVHVIPDDYYFSHGYQIIERPEFLRLRRRIRGPVVKIGASAPELRNEAVAGGRHTDPEDSTSEPRTVKTDPAAAMENFGKSLRAIKDEIGPFLD
jgi:hypothetical protein